MTAMITVLFDVQMFDPEFAPLTLLEGCIRNNDTKSLQESIRLSCELPDGCRVAVAARNLEDGTLQIIKVLYFPDKIDTKDALQYCAGTRYALISRPGPWEGGVNEKPAREKLVWRPQSSQWKMTSFGLEFNTSMATCQSVIPGSGAYWILCNIKEESGSLICAWPEAQVGIMAQDDRKGCGAATL